MPVLQQSAHAATTASARVRAPPRHRAAHVPASCYLAVAVSARAASRSARSGLSLARIDASTSAATSGRSLRELRAFSLPWPILSPLYANHAPDLSTMPLSTPRSHHTPSLEM